jgi:hypothetical protein
MNEQGTRRGRAAAAAVIALFLAAACASAAPTRIAGTLTSTPSASVLASPTSSVGPASTSTESVLPATASTVVTLAPTQSPTHKPTPVPTSRAAACTASAKYKAVFADGAAKAGFDIYCPVLPAGWSIAGASYYKRPVGSELDATYKGPGGALIQFLQGANCTTSTVACSVAVGILGPISFGHLTGQLDLYDATPTYVVYVNPGTTHGYTMLGYGMTQTQFIAFSAAMKKVPK